MRDHPSMRYKFQIFVAVIVAPVLISAMAYSNDYSDKKTDARCMGTLDLDAERSLTWRADPNMLINWQLGKVSLQIPYAYMYPRPRLSHLGCGYQKGIFGFAFWMPDLRAPARDMWSVPTYRPQEPGRQAPGKSEYIVKVAVVREMSSSSRPSPSGQLKNMLHHYKSPFEFEHEFGLNFLVRSKNPSGFDVYSNFDDGNDEILISCFRQDEFKSVNPNCLAELYFKDMDLGFSFNMPRDAVPDWKAIKAGMRALIKSWLANQ